MEQIIAKHCSTLNNTMSAKQYRYPVHYKKNGISYHTTGDGVANVAMKDIRSMYYKYGSHRMDIGEALLELADFIDEYVSGEYGASFDWYED